MRSKHNIISTVYDHKHRPVLEFYRSTLHGKEGVRFRVIGGNGEIQMGSEHYASVDNAIRGFTDLKYRMLNTSIETV